MLSRIGLFVIIATVSIGSPHAATFQITVAQARQSTVGRWDGKLEYRDYKSNGWSGLPVKVVITDGGDGVTQIRTADYDDGPASGTVRITTVSMLAENGSDESGATFRKGRPVELSTARLVVGATSVNDRNWTLIETSDGHDDDRPATVRLTTTRSGDDLVTLKEVDFKDDAKAEWLVRNRTTLKAI